MGQNVAPSTTTNLLILLNVINVLYCMECLYQWFSALAQIATMMFVM